MRRRITNVIAVLAAVFALSTVLFLPGAAAATGSSAAVAVQGQTQPATDPAPTTAPGVTPTSGNASSPAGPADSGTGEIRDAKETRVDYAPFVIGAIVLAAVIGAVVLRQRRKNKTIV